MLLQINNSRQGGVKRSHCNWSRKDFLRAACTEGSYISNLPAIASLNVFITDMSAFENTNQIPDVTLWQGETQELIPLKEKPLSRPVSKATPVVGKLEPLLHSAACKHVNTIQLSITVGLKQFETRDPFYCIKINDPFPSVWLYSMYAGYIFHILCCGAIELFITALYTKDIRSVLNNFDHARCDFHQCNKM